MERSSGLLRRCRPPHVRRLALALAVAAPSAARRDHDLSERQLHGLLAGIPRSIDLHRRTAFPAAASIPIAFVDPGDGLHHRFVATQEGAILVWVRSPSLHLTPFLDLRNEVAAPASTR